MNLSLLWYMGNHLGILIFIAYNLFIFNILYGQVPSVSEETVERFVITFGIYDKVLLEAESKNIRAGVEYWIKEFGRSVNLRVSGNIYTNIDSLRNDFKSGKLDYVHMTPGDYLQIMNEIEVDFGPMPLQGGKRYRNYQLIVRSDAPVSGVPDLRGKILSIAKDDEVGKLYLNTLLLQNRLDEIEGTFARIIEKRTFGPAILAVFFGQADACLATDYAFETIAELNPQIRTELKVLATSPDIIHTISLYRKNLDDEIKKTLTYSMCNEMDKNPAGDQVKVLFMIEGMVPGQKSDIETYMRLVQEYNMLKSRTTNPAGISEADQ